MEIKTFVNKHDFSCNVYVCSTEKNNFIIDLGYFDDDIKAYVKSLPKIDFVLQTHGHFDHIMGLNDFCKDFPGVPVYIHASEIEVAKSSVKNGSSLMSYAFVPEVDFCALKEGDNFINDEKIFVLHTPGHTQGSCIFYFANDNCVFFGDTIIEFGVGRTDLPTGNEAELVSSLEKIKEMKLPEKTMCYFGHGNSFSYGEYRR